MAKSTTQEKTPKTATSEDTFDILDSQGITLDQIREKVRYITDEYARKVLVKENIEQEVRKRLDEARNMIIFKMLGFEKDNWGRNDWRIDHCNGRSGNSTLGVTLGTLVSTEVEKWVHDQAKLPLPELPKEAIENMRKEYLDMFTGTLRKRVRDLAETHAKDAAEQIMRQAMGDYEGSGTTKD